MRSDSKSLQASDDGITSLWCDIVYVGPVGGRRQLCRVVWPGGGRSRDLGRSAGVSGLRGGAVLVLVRRLVGTIEKSMPTVSWRLGALRLWLRRRPARGRGLGGGSVGLAGWGGAWGAGVAGVWRSAGVGGQRGGRPALGRCWLGPGRGGGSRRPGSRRWGAGGACWAWRGGVQVWA